MRRIAVVVGLATAIAVLEGQRIRAVAQFPIRAPAAIEAGQEKADRSRAALFVSDRRTTRRLQIARQLIERAEYAPAIRSLQQILDDAEDSLLATETADGPQVQSAKLEALRLLGSLSSDGQQSYEVEFGPVARSMLRDAVEVGNISDLEEVARRFFHTQAGRDAVNLLGNYYLDHGDPLAAALCFERLLSLPETARPPLRRLELPDRQPELPDRQPELPERQLDQQASGPPPEPMLLLKSAICWFRAGDRQKCVDRLMSLKQTHPGPHIRLSGRRVSIFRDKSEALDWLISVIGQPPGPAVIGADDWSIFRGQVSRNPVSATLNPVWDPVWSYASLAVDDPLASPGLSGIGERGQPRPIRPNVRPNVRATDSLPQPDRAVEHDDPLNRSRFVEANIRQAELEHRKSGSVTLPAASPLAIGDVVVFRTLNRLKAVHIKSGELLWESATIDHPFEAILQGTSAARSETAAALDTRPRRFLTQRAWQDQTYGTLSSDGRHVFLLDELGAVLRFDRGRRPTADPPVDNKLVAYELQSGRLVWEIGGPRGDFQLDLAGTFFLGPPLPLRDSIYCLGEDAGEIRLLELDPSTGKLNSAQRIAFPDSKLARSPLRRFSGASPAFASGVMVCPTTAGAVVGFDVRRRLLLWGYRYATGVPDQPLNVRQQSLVISSIITGDQLDRWVDAVPIVVDGRVLLTPRDSNELHCISLVDGELYWKRPRGEGLYVAGVHGGAAIVVGRTQVQAWHLADGGDVWQEPTPIPLPSGRGILSGRFLHLPLSTAEIATINLDNGLIEARSKSYAAEVPGNLVAAGGAVVSQSLDEIAGVAAYDDVRDQVTQRLNDNPNDAAALALRGELRLHEGDHAAGLADLRKSIELKPDERAQGIVVDRLLEGLRLDFENYAKTAKEIEQIITSPGKRVRYLRLYASGLEKTQNYREAFDRYLELAESSADDPELTPVSETLSVRSDRWVRARFAGVFARAPASVRNEIDRAARNRISDASGDLERLRTLLAQFHDLPAAAAIRRALVDELQPADHALELESQLQALRRSADVSTAAYATARLALLRIDSDRPEAAAHLLEDLSGAFADVVCLDDQTGRQLLEQWQADEKTTRVFEHSARWPDRHFQANRTSQRNSIRRAANIAIIGPRDRTNDHWTLSFWRDGSDSQVLAAKDGTGRQLWTLELKVSEFGRYSTNPRMNYARVNGQLMLVVLGRQLLAIDTAASGRKARAIWSRDVIDGEHALSLLRTARAAYRPLAEIGPFNEDFVCYQVETTLFAADPLSGDLLWQRKNVPLGSRVFGDREHIFVAPRTSNETADLRTSDGEQIGTRDLPPIRAWLCTTDRRIITWTIADGRRNLASIDALTGETLWHYDFDAAARFEVIRNDEVAVMEPAGRFVIVSLGDGSLKVDSPVDPVPGLTNIVVRRSNVRYVLLSQGRADNRAARFVLPIQYRDPLVSGIAHGFDRTTGRKLWSTPIEQMSINLSQPDDLPVLMLTRRRVGSSGRGRSSNLRRNLLVLLDLRNGAVIHQELNNDPLTLFQFECDTDRTQILIKLPRSQIELTLSDTPLSEPRPANSETEADEPSTQPDNGRSTPESPNS